jgi:hypothetical protein
LFEGTLWWAQGGRRGLELSKRINKNPKLGMVVHTCNPSTWRLRQEDGEFQASLGYRVKPCLRKKKKGKL